MASDADYNLIKKQIQELAQKIEQLGGTKIADINAYIASFKPGIDGAIEALNSLRAVMKGLDTDVDYFYTALRSITSELKPVVHNSREITRSFTRLGSLARTLKLDQDAIAKLDSKSLNTLIKKIQLEKTELQQQYVLNKEKERAVNEQLEIERNVQNALQQEYQDWSSFLSISKQLELMKKTNKEAEAFLGYVQDAGANINDLLGSAAKRLDLEDKINDALGITGTLTKGIVKTLGKWGIEPRFFEDINDKMRQTAEKTGNKFAVMKTAGRGIGEGIGEGLKDPLIRFTALAAVGKFFFDAALKANKQIVDAGKNFGYDVSNYRRELVQIQSLSGNINVNTANLFEAQSQITQATGYSSRLTQDQLETQIKLTKQYGLSGDEAANINRFAILNNKTSEQTLNSFNKGLVATRNQVKVGIDMKSALVESAKVSGQLAANLGYNPLRIAEAVVKAKALGFTLSEIQNLSKSLLDFESSVSSELEAQLITGENINLDRARVLALTADYAGLAKEITDQGITLQKYGKMNVLQQESIAQAFGMSADALSDLLQKQQLAISSGKSFAAITEEENKKAMERQSIEDKFAAALLKIKSIVGDLVAGPFGDLLDSLATGLTKLSQFIGLLNEYHLLGAITGAGIGFLAGGPVGAAIGAGAGAILMHDGAIHPDGTVVSSPAGTFKLDKDDTVVAMKQPSPESRIDYSVGRSNASTIINTNELSSKLDKLISVFNDKKFQFPAMSIKLDNGADVGEWVENSSYGIA